MPSAQHSDLISETQFWRIVLNPNQFYLGRSVVLLKRPCGELSQVTEPEWRELREIIVQMESAGKKAFGATMLNWSCLMNLAYQNSPPDPQVHWHFLPRYSNSVTFAGLTFTDESFGKRNIDGKRTVPTDVLVEIRNAIKNELHF